MYSIAATSYTHAQTRTPRIAPFRSILNPLNTPKYPEIRDPGTQDLVCICKTPKMVPFWG